MSYSKKLQKALNENPFLIAHLRAFNTIYVPKNLKNIFGKKFYKFAQEIKIT